MSSLDMTVRQFIGVAGTTMRGFRLRPGAVISPHLLRALPIDCPQDGADAIAAMAKVPNELAEMLEACSRPDVGGVAGLARRLGLCWSGALQP